MTERTSILQEVGQASRRNSAKASKRSENVSWTSCTEWFARHAIGAKGWTIWRDRDMDHSGMREMSQIASILIEAFLGMIR